MPIEIREVIIKAQVHDGPEQGTESVSDTAPGQDREDMIRECVEQVLRILDDKKAR
jgi:hypothetical protein